MTPNSPIFLGLYTSEHLTQENLESPLTPPYKKTHLYLDYLLPHFHTHLKDRKKEDMKGTKDLIKKNNSPLRLTYPCFQEWNLLHIRLINGSQVASKQGLAPTRNPKYLKGRNSILQWIKFWANSKKIGSTLIPIRLLLWNLSQRPNTNSKILMICLIVYKT